MGSLESLKKSRILMTLCADNRVAYNQLKKVGGKPIGRAYTRTYFVYEGAQQLLLS